MMKPFIHRHWHGFPTIWQFCNFAFSGAAAYYGIYLLGDNWKIGMGALWLFWSFQAWNYATSFEV